MLLIVSVLILVISIICIYQLRKRSRRATCRNLERQYETVDEPIYEMILNNKLKGTGEWTDFNTNCNEAYQKIHQIL